jgi:hypothetical protein
VTVTPLAQQGRDGIGVLGSARTGLPRTLWGSSTRDDAIDRLARFPKETLPAVRDMFRLVLLARLDPPRGAGTAPPGALLTARIDAALDRGDLDAADQLIAAGGAERPDLFRRAFDVALLTGREDAACARLRANPGIAPSYPVRIFCLARTGDWPAAAITLRTAQALGALEPGMQALLDRFLDLEAYDGAAPLPQPRLPSPLEIRLHEAIGEPIPTNTLPLAFAHADLRRTAGWKARIAAAERLSHAGVLAPDRLAAIYAERAPAASGEPWDRVRAMQRLQQALDSGAPGAVTETLPEALRLMQLAGLSDSLSGIASARLTDIALTGEAARLAWRLGLRSPDYEATAARDPSDTQADEQDALLIAIATGSPVITIPDAPLGRAVAEAFAPVPPILPDGWQSRLKDGPLGLALLDALALLPSGSVGGTDPQDVTLALTVLRRIGLENTARRAALELLLQESAV